MTLSKKETIKYIYISTMVNNYAYIHINYRFIKHLTYLDAARLSAVLMHCIHTCSRYLALSKIRINDLRRQVNDSANK